MKRDFDYIRELLLKYEEDKSDLVLIPQTLDGDRKEFHHVQLLCDANLMVQVSDSAYRLTSGGHEFTAAIQDESTWQNIKAEAGDSASLETLHDIVSTRQRNPLLKKEVEGFLGNKAMYNLIVLDCNWKDGSRETIDSKRFLESPYTSNELIDTFPYNSQAKLDELKRYPCLFMNEGTENQLAHAGEIRNISHSDGNMISFEYTLYNDIAPIPNYSILKKKNSFGISDEFEFRRKHWALKQANLFRSLLSLHPVRKGPQVFEIDRYPKINHGLVSVMMPFKRELDPVFGTIMEAAEVKGLEAMRVDGIWEQDAIIRDIVNLIDRSSIVVCDCTGKNPNVFYELGIAHTLGRKVVMITQNEDDIPFDLKHLRYISYLNNGEGRNELEQDLLQVLNPEPL